MSGGGSGDRNDDGGVLCDGDEDVHDGCPGASARQRLVAPVCPSVGDELDGLQKFQAADSGKIGEQEIGADLERRCWESDKGIETSLPAATDRRGG